MRNKDRKVIEQLNFQMEIIYQIYKITKLSAHVAYKLSTNFISQSRITNYV